MPIASGILRERRIALKPDPQYWQGRRVTVTGGAGFLGYHLVTQLRELGAVVRIFNFPAVRDDHPIRQFSDVEIVIGDVLDAAAVKHAMMDASVVIHTAGLVAVWGPALAKMWAVHVDGTENVLKGLPATARLVHTSSVVAVGATHKGTLLNEDSPFPLRKSKIEYVRAKRAAEEKAIAAAKAGQDVVIVNPGYLIGPEDFDRSVMGKLCHRYWRGRVPVLLPGGFNLVDVRDVATGHLLAAEKGVPGRRYILGSENHDWASFTRVLSQAAGEEPKKLWHLPWIALSGMGVFGEVIAKLRGKETYPSIGHARLNYYRWFYESNRAQQELGYQPRTVLQSLSEAYAWYVAHHGWKKKSPIEPR
jgi:dihydroflavonol-4-reductase